MKRKHDQDSALCWCKPRLEKRCPTCAGNGTEWGSDTCWRCKGEGWIEAGPYDSDPVVIHNDVDEEISPPGRGWRIAAMVILVLILFAGMVGAALMFTPGGGR